MNFADVKSIIIPQGSVDKITNSSGTVLWQKPIDFEFYGTKTVSNSSNLSFEGNEVKQSGDWVNITAEGFGTATAGTTYPMSNFTIKLMSTPAANTVASVSVASLPSGIKYSSGLVTATMTYYNSSGTLVSGTCKVGGMPSPGNAVIWGLQAFEGPAGIYFNGIYDWGFNYLDYAGPSQSSYYTITYNYKNTSGTVIKTATTETNVKYGTVKTFSTSNAPAISGYTIQSVSPTSATITSNTTVTYTYAAGSASTTYTGEFEGDGTNVARINLTSHNINWTSAAKLKMTNIRVDYDGDVSSTSSSDPIVGTITCSSLSFNSDKDVSATCYDGSYFTSDANVDCEMHAIQPYVNYIKFTVSDAVFADGEYYTYTFTKTNA